MRRVEYNPMTGIEITYVGRGDGKIDVYQRQRCDGILDELQRRRSMVGNGKVKGPAGHQVGAIPNGLAMQWAHEEGVNLWALHPKERMAFWKRKLNDSDYKKLRVNGGTV